MKPLFKVVGFLQFSRKTIPYTRNLVEKLSTTVKVDLRMIAKNAGVSGRISAGEGLLMSEDGKVFMKGRI